MRDGNSIKSFLDNFKVVPYQDVEKLREQKSPRNMIAQKGGQENALASEADIVIAGGNRGGGKSWMLLLSVFNEIYDPNLSALILRKERDDLSNLVDKSEKLFKDFGEYKRSKDMMKWDYKAGGTLAFSFHDDPLKDFCDRFQGREYNRIGIDEITQIDFLKFKYIQSCNRNAYHLKNQLIGT
ncbi:MAG: terminase family protein, partial [Muribaculaceae bacterium]|nr:terminase family protein [Muribaculaceae bacterium]